MGYINKGIPKDLVLHIISEHRIDNFIETGTYLGETARWASKYFKKVYTIEINESISREAALNSANYNNIVFLTGDSSRLLEEISPIISTPSFFWLDAHFSSGETGGVDNECPLLREIDAILVHQKSPIIFIDDARYFLGPPPPPHNPLHWPRIDDIFSCIKKYAPNSLITIIDDVVICVPDEMKNTIDIYWRKTFKNRFPLPDEIKLVAKNRHNPYFPEKKNIGGWVEKEYLDIDHTYKTILKMSPRIAILYYRNKIYGKLKKIINFFRGIST